jgi:AcrR family transcriptional regulator
MTTGTTRPRTKPPEVRREELLDAAETLFLVQGIAATSVDAIVAGADVAKGTFYLHFDSKEQLLAALRQRYIDNYCKELRVAMDEHPPNDWRGRLRAWVVAGVDGYLDHRALHDLVFHQFRPGPRHATHKNSTADQLSDFLTAGSEAGAWTLRDPRLTAMMLFHALHGALDEGCARSSSADSAIGRGQLTRTLHAFFEQALALPADPIPRSAAR